VSNVPEAFAAAFRTSGWRGIFTRTAAVPGLILGTIAIWIAFQIATEGIFLTDRNLINLGRQTAVTAIVALGMLVVIAHGEIDLSVGSLLGLTATIAAMLEQNASYPFWLTVLVAVAIGGLAGLWNGVWVAVLGIPAFVATLGGLLMFRGISLALSEGETISGLSPNFRELGVGYLQSGWLYLFLGIGFLISVFPLVRLRWAVPAQREGIIRKSIVLLLILGAITWATTSYRGLPAPVAVALVLAVILSWALDNTVWGRHAYAVGSSREASRIAGVRVRQQIVSSFVLIGLLTGLAAVIFVGRLGSAPPGAGLFLELDAIAAVVIGGASLYGGTGRVSGVLLGALLTQSLLNGLSLLNVQTAYQYITSGVVLMLAVFIDAVSKRGGRIVVRM
jgi:D-xylose transport system permease protein